MTHDKLAFTLVRAAVVGVEETLNVSQAWLRVSSPFRSCSLSSPGRGYPVSLVPCPRSQNADVLQIVSGGSPSFSAVRAARNNSVHPSNAVHLGLCGSALSTMLFGLSNSLPAALAARMLGAPTLNLRTLAARTNLK